MVSVHRRDCGGYGDVFGYLLLLTKAAETLRTVVDKTKQIVEAARSLKKEDVIKMKVSDADVDAIRSALRAGEGCGDEPLLAEAAEALLSVQECNSARKDAEQAAAEEKKRVEEAKAAKKAAKAAKKEKWKKKVAEATEHAKASRDPAPLQAVLDEAAAENMLQGRYEDDTFVSVSIAFDDFVVFVFFCFFLLSFLEMVGSLDRAIACMCIESADCRSATTQKFSCP